MKRDAKYTASAASAAAWLSADRVLRAMRGSLKLRQSKTWYVAGMPRWIMCLLI